MLLLQRGDTNTTERQADMKHEPASTKHHTTTLLALSGAFVLFLLSSCDLSLLFTPQGADNPANAVIDSFELRSSVNPVLSSDLPTLIVGDTIIVYMNSATYAAQHALIPTIDYPDQFTITPTGAVVFYTDKVYTLLDSRGNIAKQYTVTVQVTVD
jgi:hypothetical protein